MIERQVPCGATIHGQGQPDESATERILVGRLDGNRKVPGSA